MNAKDFDFLRRKEILVLSVCLLALAFSQIALEQQISYFSPNGRKSEIQPFLILDHSIFELLGILLPIFTLIFIIFYWTGSDYLSKIRNWMIAVTLLIFIVLAFLVIIIMQYIYIPMLPMELDDTDKTTLTPTTPVTSNQPPTISVSLKAFLEWLINFRNLFLISILLLPLLFLFWLQRGTTDALPVKPDVEGILSEDKQRLYQIKSILECYYQASNALEERGAENSPSLTPTEFSIDVIAKNLTSISTIDGITNLFEAAKFSNHQMSTKDVKLAKIYAREIISIDWLDDEEWGEEEKIKPREGKD
ncbi:MAG: DUF4129 domain-containing protein [Candidatus Hodarchaeota archaeon]